MSYDIIGVLAWNSGGQPGRKKDSLLYFIYIVMKKT